MISSTRGIAGGLTIVEAVWFLYAYFDGSMYNCPANGCLGPSFVPSYSLPWLALALVLLVVGAFEIWGASIAFTAGVILSASALALAGYDVAVTNGFAYLLRSRNDGLIGVAFALTALVLNFNAMRMKRGISEQANPMNLPVFG